MRRWTPSPSVAWQSIDGEGVIINLDTGRALGLNATGTFVWTELYRRDENEIAAALADRFDVDRGTALSDVRSLLDEMLSHGVVIRESN